MQTSTLSGTQAIEKLNTITRNGASQSLKIHFDSLDAAFLLSVTNSAKSYCVAGTSCSAAPFQQSMVSIGGYGHLSGTSLDSTVLDQLHLDVTYDPQLSNGNSCLTKAQEALSRGLQFNIEGSVQLIPMDATNESGASAAEPSENDSQTVGTLVSKAQAVNQGYMPMPLFANPWVGAVLKSIDSCSEGDAALAPPPPPNVNSNPGGTVCTMMALLCADGTPAPRDPVSCNFLPCAKK